MSISNYKIFDVNRVAVVAYAFIRQNSPQGAVDHNIIVEELCEISIIDNRRFGLKLDVIPIVYINEGS